MPMSYTWPMHIFPLVYHRNSKIPTHQGTQLGVAALWRSLLPKLRKYKKSTVCSKQTLRSTVCEEYTVLFPLPNQDRHRLHSVRSSIFS